MKNLNPKTSSVLIVLAGALFVAAAGISGRFLGAQARISASASIPTEKPEYEPTTMWEVWRYKMDREGRCRDASESYQTSFEMDYADGCVFDLQKLYGRFDDDSGVDDRGIAKIAVVPLGIYTLSVTSSDFLCESGDEKCTGGHEWYRLSFAKGGHEIKSVRMENGVVTNIWKAKTGSGADVVIIRAWNGGNSAYSGHIQVIRGSEYGIFVGAQVVPDLDGGDSVGISNEELIREAEYGLRILTPVWRYDEPDTWTQ